MTQLEQELGSAESLPTEKLSARELAELTDAVRQARARHAAELQQSIANALEQVPWVLRGALRKVLF